jgi:TRAP-type C4-dicarboxylate transport system permease small subunit
VAGAEPSRAGLLGLARRIIALWALFGGLVLLAVVLVNAVSIIGAALGTLKGAVALFAFIPEGMSRPFPGDFELTEMGVAIAAFAFLPYCQTTGSNVTADIFTTRASSRWIARFTLAASVVALLFAVLLMTRLWLGMEDLITYRGTTAILQIPAWWAFLPCILSLALLAVAAAVTLAENLEKA